MTSSTFLPLSCSNAAHDFRDRRVLPRIEALLPPDDEVGAQRAERSQDDRGKRDSLEESDHDLFLNLRCNDPTSRWCEEQDRLAVWNPEHLAGLSEVMELSML